MTTCFAPDQLDKFVSGNLGPTEERLVENHILECNTCFGYIIAQDSECCIPDNVRLHLTLTGTGAPIPFIEALKSSPPPPTVLLPDRSTPDVLLHVLRDAEVPARSDQMTMPVIDGYEILSEIGRGGMGVVYKARNNRLARVVALKMLLAGQHAGATALTRFRNEASAIAHIRHEHIVTVYHVGEVGARDGAPIPFVELEFCSGGSLDCHLDGTPWPARSAAFLLEKLALGIAAAHQVGIIHRDLKPGNILFQLKSESGDDFAPANRGVRPLATPRDLDTMVPKVSDFGLAKMGPSLANRDLAERDPTRSGEVFGTPEYMPPEQARGDSHSVGAASDVYALGAILYELMTGRPPFRGVTPADTLLQVMSEQDPIPPRRLQTKVPKDLETICLKCLEKQSDRRYVQAAELAADLRRFLEDRPIHARPVGLSRRTVKWVRRHRTFSIAAAALLIAMPLVAWAAIGEIHRAEARVLVSQIESFDVSSLPYIIDEPMAKNASYVESELMERLRRSTSTEPWRYQLALLSLSRDAGNLRDLVVKLLDSSPEELLVIRGRLANYKDRFASLLWEQSKEGDTAQRFNAACALALYDPTSPRWAEISSEVSNTLIHKNPVYIKPYIEALRPVSQRLLPNLMKFYSDNDLDDSLRSLSANVLLEFVEDSSRDLAELFLLADDKRFEIIRPSLDRLGPEGAAQLAAEIRRTASPAGSLPFPEVERIRVAKRRANAALCLLSLNQDRELALSVLGRSPDASARNYLIHRMSRLGGSWYEILQPELARADSQDRDPFALLLSMGQFREADLQEDSRSLLLSKIEALYREHPDPAVHSAASWLLKRWGHPDRIEQLDQQLARTWPEVDRELISSAPLTKPRWVVISDVDVSGDQRRLQTFVMLPAPGCIALGADDTDPERDKEPGRETKHWTLIDRSFAVSTTEVTFGEFLRFDPDREHKRYRVPAAAAPNAFDRFPINGVNWYTALAYCNWLTERHGIGRSEQCVPEVSNLDLSAAEAGGAACVKLPTDYLHKHGYRLPTEAEWEYVCRGGSTTSRFCGTLELLGEYSRNYVNTPQLSMSEVGTLKPNDFGMFDMLGNALEWTLEPYRSFAPNTSEHPLVDTEFPAVVSNHAANKNVMRGGSFYNPPARLTSFYRYKYQPMSSLETHGFRLVRTLPR